MQYAIAPFTRAHGPGLLEVFNHFVEHSFAAYPHRKVGDDFVKRFETYSLDYPVLTVLANGGRVLGFGAVHAFHPADSFKRTGEIGYFLHPDAVGCGIGTALLARLVEGARAKGIRTLIASISSRNER
jgi:phosphinothricin acetyltransferase